MGATVSLTSGHHLQTNGQTEWLNQYLETGLRCAAPEPSLLEQVRHVGGIHPQHPAVHLYRHVEVHLFQCVFGYELPLLAVLENRCLPADVVMYTPEPSQVVPGVQEVR